MSTRPTIEVSNRHRIALFCVSVFVAALAVRLLNQWHLNMVGLGPLVEDSTTYLQLADMMSAALSDLFTSVDGFHFDPERMPLYGIFLSLSGQISNDMVGAAVFLQAILDSFTVLIIAVLGWYIKPSLGTVSAVLGIFWPNMVIHSSVILTDTLFLFFVSCALLCFAAVVHRKGIVAAGGAGGFLGLAILVRSVGQFMPLGMLVSIFAVTMMTGSGLRKSIMLSLIALATTIIVLTPYMRQSYLVTGKVQFTNQGPTHLLNWVLPLLEVYQTGGNFDETSLAVRSEFEQYLSDAQIDPAAKSSFEMIELRGKFAVSRLLDMSPMTLAKGWGIGIVMNMGTPAVFVDPRVRSATTTHFLDQQETLFARIVSWLSAFPPGTTVVVLLGVFGSIAVTVLQGIGIVSLLRQHPMLVLFGICFAAYFLMLAGPVVGPKYRLPFEPVSIILTASGLCWIWDRWCAGSPQSEPVLQLKR